MLPIRHKPNPISYPSFETILNQASKDLPLPPEHASGALELAALQTMGSLLANADCAEKDVAAAETRAGIDHTPARSPSAFPCHDHH